MNQKSDGELLRIFAADGDEAAFGELLNRHGRMVLHACRQILDYSQDAEDALQATFLTLAKKAKKMRRKGSVAAWLYRVAVRSALDLRKANRRRQVREQKTMDQMLTSKEDQRQHTEHMAHVLEVVETLPTKLREAIILHHMEGHSHEEAAAIIGCKTNAYSVRLTRGRELLRKRLSKGGVALTALAISSLLTTSAEAAPSVTLVTKTMAAAHAVTLGHSMSTIGLSSQVLQLTKGMQAMLYTEKLKMVAAYVTAILLGAGGLTLIPGGTADAGEPKVILKTNALTQRDGRDDSSDSRGSSVQVSSNGNVKAPYPNWRDAGATPSAADRKRGAMISNGRLLFSPDKPPVLSAEDLARLKTAMKNARSSSSNNRGNIYIEHRTKKGRKRANFNDIYSNPELLQFSNTLQAGISNSLSRRLDKEIQRTLIKHMLSNEPAAYTAVQSMSSYANTQVLPDLLTGFEQSNDPKSIRKYTDVLNGMCQRKQGQDQILAIAQKHIAAITRSRVLAKNEQERARTEGLVRMVGQYSDEEMLKPLIALFSTVESNKIRTPRGERVFSNPAGPALVNMAIRGIDKKGLREFCLKGLSSDQLSPSRSQSLCRILAFCANRDAVEALIAKAHNVIPAQAQNFHGYATVFRQTKQKRVGTWVGNRIEGDPKLTDQQTFILLNSLWGCTSFARDLEKLFSKQLEYKGTDAATSARIRTLALRQLWNAQPSGQGTKLAKLMHEAILAKQVSYVTPSTFNWSGGRELLVLLKESKGKNQQVDRILGGYERHVQMKKRASRPQGGMR